MGAIYILPNPSFPQYVKIKINGIYKHLPALLKHIERIQIINIRRKRMLETGTKAPDFSLADQNGEMHSLKNFEGKKLILYFYPKDNTAGCTKQARGFSELKDDFAAKGVSIVGVSRDSVKSHKNFETKQELSITLLSDPEHETIEAYDAWKEKKNYGKVSMGTVRTTYVIDEKGIIIWASDKIKAADNPAQMLEGL